MNVFCKLKHLRNVEIFVEQRLKRKCFDRLGEIFISCLALTEHVGKHCSNENIKSVNYRIKALPQTIFGLFLFFCLPLLTFHYIPVAKKETPGKTLPSLLLKLLLLSSQDPMQAVQKADPRALEPTQESLGISEGLMRSHLNNGVLETFAQNMAENIVQSFVSQMEMVEPEADFGLSRFNQNQEMLAEDLASTVIEVALKEVCRGRKVQDHVSDGVEIDQFDSERDLDIDTEMDQGNEVQTSKDTRPYNPPLSQSGLPVVGSLDYPDAPPTTPLLPELEKSRSSFTRKLKGGLAKVFLPSPPPPTPKDHEDDSDGADPHAELMEHLMHSLPSDDLERDYLDLGPYHGAKVEAFAEALSCDIIDWVLSAKNAEQITDGSDLHLLAHQLAETIITSSLDEAKMLI